MKHLTIENLPLHEVVPVLGEFLQLYYIRNSGAAFSLGSGVTWIFTIALSVVAVVIIWKAFNLRSRWWAVVLGVLLGGVLGNLTDRLFREPGFGNGHVVDMISMPWMMPAIFNVADIFIVTGMISVALLVVLGLRFDGTRERDHATVETEEEAEAAAVAAEEQDRIADADAVADADSASAAGEVASAEDSSSSSSSSTTTDGR